MIKHFLQFEGVQPTNDRQLTSSFGSFVSVGRCEADMTAALSIEFGLNGFVWIANE